MKLHRFFVSGSLLNKKEFVTSDKELINQWRNVLRLQPSETIILLDNSGSEFSSIITELRKDLARVEIINSQLNSNEPEKEIWLFQSLIKKDNFEWILEKCTEIGVSHFVPVLSERSEKKNINTERAEKILKEAAEQSGRGKLPVLHPIQKLQEVFEDSRFPNNDSRLVAFDPNGQSSPTDYSLLTTHSIGYLIGPEGGWSENELEFFRKNKIEIFNLGKRILRSETAAIVSTSKFLI